MITYYELTEYFFDALTGIDDVKTIVNMDAVYNEFSPEDYEPCLAVCIFNTTTSEDSHVVYDVRVEVMDLVDVSNDNPGSPDYFKSNDNILDVYNTTLSIVRRLHLQLRHKTTGSNAIQIDPSPTLEKLFDASQRLAGHAINMTIRVDDGVTSLC